MAERYTKIYALEKALYADGAPVVISSGSLLADNLTKGMVVQLRFKSISEAQIKTLAVRIEALDDEGASMWMPVEHQYTDIKSRREEIFGKNVSVPMPEGDIHSFTVAVTEVGFEDGSRWELGSGEWTDAGSPRTITDALGDEELYQQFTIRYGSDCRYLPEDDGRLWFCACGATNPIAELKCHRCRRVYSALKAINLNALRTETAQRVELEKKNDDEQQEELKKKRSTYLKLGLILIPVIAVLILILATVPKFMAQKQAYEQANELLLAGEYEKAQQAFEALGDYGDSADHAKNTVPYHRAMYIMGCAKAGDVQGLLELGMKRSDLAEDETVSVALYKQAAEMFLALGDYMDSPQQREAAISAVNAHYESLRREAYESALALIDSADYCAARDALEAMDGYADSVAMAQEAMYRRAVALYELTEKYFMLGVECRISNVTGEKSVFYITESAFASQGKELSADIRELLRGDGVEVNIKDTPEGEGYVPICKAVNQLFLDLGDYKDSAEYAAKALANGDFTKPFYDYCESGQLLAAYQWLAEYKDEFEYREQWMGLLQTFGPYCGSWELLGGDPSLIPMTLGVQAQCGRFSSVVTIKESDIKLRIQVEGFESYPIELPLTVGSNSFSVCNDGFSTFVALVTPQGKFQYSRYLNSGLQAGTYSCEYVRMG